MLQLAMRFGDISVLSKNIMHIEALIPKHLGGIGIVHICGRILVNQPGR